ncbi:pentatricopeptide repeat-containing protein At3g57430, chloroplastic-like [Wolffia australiana]
MTYHDPSQAITPPPPSPRRGPSVKPAEALARASLPAAIKASNDVRAGRSLHALVIKTGRPDLADHVLCMYAHFSRADDARRLFDETPNQTPIATSALMSAYSRRGEPGLALALARAARPNAFVLSGAAAACGKLRLARAGRQVHARAAVAGLAAGPFVTASLVAMYARSGDPGSAAACFRLGPAADPAVVNAMVCGLAAAGHSKEALELLREAWAPSAFTGYTFVGALTACCDDDDDDGARKGEQVHAAAVKCGCESDRFVSAALVDVYGGVGDREAMARAFRAAARPDVALHNAMMVGYTQRGWHGEALGVLAEMRRGGLRPDECSLSGALKACGGLRLLRAGRAVHGLAERSGARRGAAAAAVDMYMKCGEAGEARRVFEGEERRSAVVYNAMIAGLGLNRRPDEAGEVLAGVGRGGGAAGLAAVGGAGGAAGGAARWAAYAAARKRGFAVEKALLWGLLRGGEAEAGGEMLRRKMEEPGVEGWTAGVSGLARLGLFSGALRLVNEMRAAGAEPNARTLASALKACAGLAGEAQGRAVHALALKRGVARRHAHVAGAAVEMYARCGAAEESRRAFREAEERDAGTWNAMIGGCAGGGRGREAVELLEEMEGEGVAPGEATFASVLAACSRSGMVEEGARQFERMGRVHGVEAGVEHYACMVDLFGRAGMLDRARGFIESMPFQSRR